MSEGKIVKKFSICSAEDWTYMESWLQDMARNGLIFRKYGFLMSEFEVSDPQEIRYRLLPKKYSEVRNEERELYEASGWKFAGRAGNNIGNAILYTTDPDAPELFTDKESYEKYTRKIRASLIISTAICLLCILLWARNLLRDLVGGPATIAHALYDYGLTWWLYLVLITLCLLTGYALMTYKNYDLRRQLSKGIELDHDIDYRRRARLNKVHIALIIAMIVGLIICAAMSFSGNESDHVATSQESLNADTSMMVGIQSFAPDEWEKGLSILPESPASDIDEDTFDYEEGKEYASYRVESDNSMIMPTNMYMQFSIYKAICENGMLYDRNISTWYSEDLKEAVNSRFAESFLKEEIRRNYYYMTENDIPETFLGDIQVECEGLDYVGYYSSQDIAIYSSNSQELYMRKGRWMIQVSYEGEKDLRDSISLYANKLKELSGEH